MARLTIEQIKAPDLSVASAATARAGESFREGMSSASDLLSQYQSGLETQGDAELTNLLAGAKNEDEWNSILATTDFSRMNLSAAMRQNIMNRRDNILGYENQRADTRLVNANTGNVNASIDRTRNATRIDTNQDNRAGDIHGVTMADHAWRQGARVEDASNAGLALRAAEEGVTNGYSQPGVSGLTPENVSGLNGGPGTNLGPRADGSGLRDPSGSFGTDRQIAYRNGIAAIESDGSGGYEAVGARHETLGRALGRYQIMEANIAPWSRAALGREVSVEEFMANPVIQDAIFDHRFGQYVERYGEENAARAWFGGEGGINNTGASDVHGRLTIGDYGQEFVNQLGGGTRSPVTGGSRVRATQNPNQGGSAQRAYLDALANSQYQSTADVLSAYESQYDYNQTGQAALTAEDTRLAEEALAQRMLDIAQVNVDPTEAVVEFQRDNPGATAVERLRFEAKVLEATGDGGALSAARLQIGTTGASLADISRADATIGVIQEELQRNPFTRAHMNAGEFESDPAGSMVSALEGLGISTTPSDVQSAINSLAEDLKITPGQAAYAYARAAEQESRLGRFLSIGGDNLSNNAAYKYARENFTGDRGREARNDIATARRRAEQVQKATSDLGRVERRIQKLRQQGNTVPTSLMSERDELAGVLQNLYEEFGGGTPADASGSTQAGPTTAAAQLEAAAPTITPLGMQNRNPLSDWNAYLQ